MFSKNLSYDSDYAIINKGDLTIDGDGSIKGRGGIKSTAGKLTINGGIYTASSDYTQNSYQHALKAENTEVVINGGTFGSDSAKPNAIINVARGSNVTINGGTFKNVTGALSRFDPYLFTYENDGKLIINDGTFYGGWRFNAAAATTDICGGNFTVTYDGQSFNAESTHVLTVYGGNFTPVAGVTATLANKLSDVVAEGYLIVDNADGTKTVLDLGISEYPNAEIVSDVTEFTNVIQNANDGAVIALADDMMLTAPMTINKDITIVGNGNTISGKSITAQADVTFKNVKLSKPDSTNKTASLVYAYDGCEKLVFDGCTFSDPQWEAMQITSNNLQSVTITNCTFTAANVDGAANSGYGSDADQAIRFIHIQPSNYPVVNIKITNNKFFNCDKIADGVVGIYYVSKNSTITVGGNTFEGLAIENGNSGKLSVGWPEVEMLKTVSYWTSEATTTFVIDSTASNPRS